MLHLNYNSTKDLTFFLQPSLPAPVYLLSLVNYTTRERKSFIAQDTSTLSSMLQITVTEIGTGLEDILTGSISIGSFGRYTLEVYEQASTTNIDVDNATFLGDDELIFHKEPAFDNPPLRNIIEEESVCVFDVTVNATAEQSENANDGTATATPLNFIGSVTYLWNDPLAQTTQTATGLAPGIYTVIATDDFVVGCTSSDSDEVIEFVVDPSCSISVDSVTPTPESFEGAGDGSALAVVSGNIGAVHYMWSDGQTVNPAVNLGGGAIGVCATDSGVSSTCVDSGVTIITHVTNLFAADFSGSNHLSSADSIFDKGDEDFSLSCWFNPTALTGQSLMGKWDNSPNFAFDMFISSVGLRCFISSNGTTYVEAQIPATIILNNWHFAVFKYDSVNNLLGASLDGSAFVTIPHIGGANVSTGSDFRVGGRNPNILNMVGATDSASVWTKAISESEKDALYNIGAGQSYFDMNKAGLQNHWKLNELTGSRIDFHGSNNLTDNSSVSRTTGKIND